MACIMRDYTGIILGVEAVFDEGTYTSLHAEGLAIFRAMQWANHLKNLDCCFETDCIEAFNQIQTYSGWQTNMMRCF